MFEYSIIIPIRSSLQSQALDEFSQNYLKIGPAPELLGHPIKNLDCTTGMGEKYIECTVTFRSETLMSISGLRQMLKGLFMLDMEVKWCGPGASGLILSAVGQGIIYEAIIVPEPGYAGFEACLI